MGRNADDQLPRLAQPTYSNCKVSSAQEVAAGQYRAEFPYFNTIGFATNGDISNYDALQATLQARGYHGLSFLAGYTYSHALSESDGNSNSGIMVVSDKNNLRLNYGASNSDLRHHFTFSPTYAIPGIKSPGQMLEGWALSGIVVLQSGLPWNPSDSSVDWLGTGESANSAPQYWNYSGPTSAFKVTASPIPCFGKYSGCTPYPTVGGVPQLPAACVSCCDGSLRRPDYHRWPIGDRCTHQYRLLRTGRRRSDSSRLRNFR